ncbi:FAD-binding domain-containing protein [Hypoxylon sp. FL1857]|nr:FAD-binding domain-containing protein [Hypoxylon sp. FL1857]
MIAFSFLFFTSHFKILADLLNMFLGPWWIISGLVLSALGEASSAKNPSSDPVALLRRKGIASDRLNEISLGLKTDDGCFCSLACDTLASIFGGDSVDIVGQESYETSRSKFWSQQQSQDARPRCFVHPMDAEDVSVIVLLSRATQCPFAVKGGGHTPFKGGSNSDGGITIDFGLMKGIIPSADKKSVTIGPGNTWVDVYTTLEKFNLTMAGGRTATVGVGGLTLGGGISFFSGQYGMTCDNIINFEIVLGSGEIITVDANTNADLFWALRGGGGNFGIVTQFVAHAFEQGPIWGGTLGWEMHSSKVPLIDAMISYAEKGSKEDPKGAHIQSFAYAQTYQMWISATMVHHSDPQSPGNHPEVFDDILSIENPFLDTTRSTSHSNHTIEIDAANPVGLRQSYWVFATYVDRQLALDILDIFEEEVNPMRNFTGIIPSLVYQIITVPQLKAMTRNGGNALGIGGGKKPLFLVALTVMWMLKSDDEAVLTAMSNCLSRSQELARERGLDHSFLYMNYASQFQDPIASYGAENRARLLEVSKKYDPEGVFQSLNPGHFKLKGPPVRW